MCYWTYFRHLILKLFTGILWHLVKYLQDMRAATAASRGCDAAWRGEENVIQATTGLTATSPEGMAFTKYFSPGLQCVKIS